MKQFSILLLALAMSGCTTYSISNQSLLAEEPYTFSEYQGEYQDKAIRVDVDMHCKENGRSGRIIHTRCSNKERLESLVKHFKERGYNVHLAKDEQPGPTIAIKEESSGVVTNFSTGMLNLLTLGLVPAYRYSDYIVSYKDPANDVVVTQKMRISEAKSWFHMFMSNPDNIEGRDWQNDAEQNLIHVVLDEAGVGNTKQVSQSD